MRLSCFAKKSRPVNSNSDSFQQNTCVVIQGECLAAISGVALDLFLPSWSQKLNDERLSSDC